jgi:hypothetical protein
MFKKTLLTTTALSVLVSSVAVAELKVSGTQEWELGNTSYSGTVDNANKISGSETVIKASGSGDLGGGNSYTVVYEFSNGDQDVVQANLNFGAFDIEIGQNGSAGIEEVKALLPFVNNRIQDIGGTGFGNNLQDNSSGQTYFAANAKTGDLGAVSIAYNPNQANGKTAGTDGVSGETNTGSSVSGSFKGSLGVEGLTVGVGYLKGSNAVTANDNKKSETVGVAYNAGSFAIGYQRMKQTADAVASATQENTMDLYGISYKVADNLSVGVYKIDDTKAVEGSADVELSSTLLSIGYNLGAAKVSYDYITADNYAHTTSKDAKLHRVKIGMAF